MPSALTGDTFNDPFAEAAAENPMVNMLAGVRSHFENIPDLPANIEDRRGETGLYGGVRNFIRSISPRPNYPDEPLSVPMFQADSSITELGETGVAGPHGQSNISPDTGGSRSYGILGLNSHSGSAAHFARSYPQLGLTADPGTPTFDYQWRQAAAEQPATLYAAQRDWHAKNVVVPVHDGLLASGANPAVANDPRVLNYLADRRVQMGNVGWQPAMQMARTAQSPEDYIHAVSAHDRANVGTYFQSYLADHPNDVSGLNNRIALREGMSLDPSWRPAQGQPGGSTGAQMAGAAQLPALSSGQPAGTLGALSAIMALTNQNQQRPAATAQAGLSGLYPQPPQQSALASDPMTALKAIAPILRVAQSA